MYSDFHFSEFVYQAMDSFRITRTEFAECWSVDWVFGACSDLDVYSCESSRRGGVLIGCEIYFPLW